MARFSLLVRRVGLMMAGLTTLLSCHSDEGTLTQIAAYRVTPRALSVSTDSATTAWALFDRDTAQGYEPIPPDALDANVELTITLDPGTSIEALKVFGASPYRVWLLDEQGQALSGPHDLSTLPDGWTTLPLAAPHRADVMTIRFETTGEGDAAVPELELWGTGPEFPLAWEPAAPGAAADAPPPGLADIVPAAPGYQSISRDQGTGMAACAAFTFTLERNPGVYRKAWLHYRTEGVFRPLVLTRIANSSQVTPGFWVPPASSEPGAFMQPLEPEILRMGTNKLEFCQPGDARGVAQISDVAFIGELDHGSNIIEALSIAPFDGIPTESAKALLDGTGTVTLDPAQELVVGFERWTAPDAIRVTSHESVSWSLRCVGSGGEARDLPATAIDGSAGEVVYAIDDAGRGRCAGLRMRPSGTATVTDVRVFGSGTDRRVDFPQIVLASAREHFGHEAWIEGWVRVPSRVGGDVHVYIDDEETDTTTGVFARMLQRTTGLDEAWPVTITARFADGSSVTRQFLLDRDAGTMPGAEARNPLIDDGLTEDERRRRFGNVDDVAEADAQPGEARRIELGTHVSVDIPARAVKGRARISVRHMSAAEVPPLDPGLINVTAPFKHAYEFQPHGQVFDDALKVTLPYQPSLLPPGHVPEDVQTFYYDEDLARWEPLARAEVVRDRQVLESLTDHFTVMINAVVVAPEHPQAAAFDPNRLKGIEAATPAAGIQLIAPPEPNSRGDATMSYPLELPPGRLGVQPSFALSYSSARGNGWVGMGWDVGASAIEVETRWGVPRYHGSLETETYLLDGAQLSPTAHREQPRSRSQGTTRISGETVKIFRPRIEGTFQRIVRHGTGPQSYWWEVTDGKGTRYFYGGAPETGMDAAACLSDNGTSSGHIYRWALREVRDTHGNRVRYDYDEVTHTPENGVPGRDLYLASAHYTLRAGETTAPYRVVFLREPGCASEGQTGCRPDLMVNGRGGFKQTTSERLQRIEVYYRQTLVRAWHLEYDRGPFGKSRLRALRQLGVNGKPFPGNVHTFDYFDEVTETTTEYSGFGPVEHWNAGVEKPDSGLALPDALFGATGEAQASALGGSRTRSLGGHVYTGTSFGTDKWLSVGAKVGRRSDETNGQLVLVDIDGDALPDRVFRGADGAYYFNRNASGPSNLLRFTSPALRIDDLPALSREVSLMRLSAGPEAYAFPGQLHENQAFSSTQQDTYLADVNADGLVDLVQGSIVHFNWLGENGVPRFVLGDSSGTPMPVGTSAVALDVLPASFEDSELENVIDEHTPPVDTVRVWQAPYAGRVRITGEVRLAQAQRAGADGLRASIEHQGAWLWTHTFGRTETAPQHPSIETDVAAGDHVYFRLHALNDASDDRVHWSPLIEYVDHAPGQDENGLANHRFDASSDFALAGRADAGMHAPFRGTLRISGRLTKIRETTDDVRVMVMVGDEATFSRALEAASPGTLALDERIRVEAGDFIALRIHTDSPIDLSALTFEQLEGPDGSLRHGPWLRYEDARDEQGKRLPVEDHNGKPIFDIPQPYDMTTYALRAPAMPVPAFVPLQSRNLHVTAVVDAGFTGHTGTVTFAAKSGGRLLGKEQVTISNGGVHTMRLQVPVTASEPVFFSFSVSNPDLFAAITTSASSEAGALPTIRYGIARPGRLSQPYRGWSYGGYNGAGARGSEPIPPGVLDAPPAFDEGDALTQDTARDLAAHFQSEELLAFPFFPLPDTLPCQASEAFACSPVEGGHWQGTHELIYVTAGEMSTSRLGGPVPRAPSPEELAGGRAVPRFSRSHNLAVGGGVVPTSLSEALGESLSLLDYIDLNGDGFPDVMSPERVQYTTPLGVLAERRDIPPHALRVTTSSSTTMGIGGNIASAVASARALVGTGANKATGGSASTQQMQPVGFVLNLGGSDGSATTAADLQDVNGDGLPDRVWKGDRTLEVALNLGYRFADREPWGPAVIHEGISREYNAGASLSFNTGNYGFGGGINGGNSDSGTSSSGGTCGGTLLDVNGDGLPDCAERASDGLRVWFNLGHGFASTPVSWRGGIGGADITASQSTTLGSGVYFTVGFGIGVVNLIVNPGVDASESIGRSTTAMRDIDGDGYPDQLISDNPHEITVARNRTGRTDLLEHVKRPLGADIWLDYERAGNTQDMPQSRWVLSEIKVYDGQDDSAELGQATDYTLQRIRYGEGRYDRYERELYGFGRVEIDTLDTRGWDGSSPASDLPVYRQQELEYLTRSYHERGLLAASRTLDGDGAVFERATYQYELRDVETGSVLTPEQAASAEAAFPALVREDHYRHEGNPEQFTHTFTTHDYDAYGNVIALHDAGGPGTSDDYRAEMRYTARLATCRAYNIVGVADRIIVRDAAGAILRQREADVDCSGGRGDIRQIRVALGGTAVAETDLAYDSDGNLASVTAPPNHRGRRYQLRYTHDAELATHVVRIDDSFGYYSTAEHDPRFGLPTRETDINGNSVITAYDDFGRTTNVRGPYELERGLEYTIRFTYAPDAVVPFAATAHMDASRNVADPIETVTFVDGLGRPIQTKKDATLHRGVDAAAQDAMIVSGRLHLDPWGRVVARWHPSEEPKSAINLGFSRMPEPSAPPTRITHDLLGREREIVMPDGTRALLSHALIPALSGEGVWAQATTINAENNRRDTYRDGRGNIRAVAEYLDGRAITTRYEYDPLAQLRRVIDAAGNITRSDYDLAGRRIGVLHPDSGHTEMVYDPAGNLIRKITANLRREGTAIEYGYDLTHLVEIRYPRFPENDVTYTWGAAAQRGQGGNLVGRIARVDDASGFEERRYGLLGEVVQERRSVAGHTQDENAQIYVTQYLYDTWGRLQQVVYPDTEVLTYAYDAGGQVRAASGVKLGVSFPYVARLEYDRFEQRAFLQTGNGIRTHYDYDPRNRRLATLAAGEFQRLEYGYDAVGNITSLVNDVPNARPGDYGGRLEQRFSYDDLYRLIDASGTWHQPQGKRNEYTYTLQYDDIHNITYKNQRHWRRNRGGGKEILQHATTYEQGYSYGSARPHAATHIGERTFHYDDNGNQLGWTHDQNGQRRTIVWDEENRVRSISDPGRTTSFVYDHDGDRIIKAGAQGETVYVNDKWTVRNRTIGTKHVYVGTTRIASKLSPGAAHVQPDEQDHVSVMLGKWWEHRSQHGHERGRNVEMNPHYQVPSELPGDGMPDSNFVYFYHPDHLGSTSYATDADGELYEHVQYFPSGETWVDQRSNTERLPHLFSGKELDQETGLYYFGARYYDPRVGLWASTDPAQTEYLDGAGVGGVYSPINLATYTYAASNPLRFVDPDGRSWLDWVQNALDGASIALDATGIGGSVSWLPDVVNAGISAVRGDWTGAGMSLSAAVPYVGAPANAGRLGRALAKHGDEAIDLVRDAGKAADGFRSFTQRNFRENLTRLTGRAPDGAQAHHIFPVKFEGKFKEAGIDIHDPKYGAWWNTSGHKQAAHDYNAAWQEFFRTNPSSEQIKQFGRDIAKKYALDVHF